MPIIDTETCRTSYGNSLADGMICAGYNEGGKDACQVTSLTLGYSIITN